MSRSSHGRHRQVVASLTIPLLQPHTAIADKATKLERQLEHEAERLGEKAGVVSHITAATAAGKRIEADVMNYFSIVNGQIAYMANFHDTAPFHVLAQA